MGTIGTRDLSHNGERQRKRDAKARVPADLDVGLLHAEDRGSEAISHGERHEHAPRNLTAVLIGSSLP